MLWFEAKKGGNWESSTRLDQVWPLSLFLEFLEPLNSSIESFTSWNIAKCIKVKKQISRDGKGSEKTKSHYQLKKSLELVLSIDFRPRTSPKTSAINRLQTYARTSPRHRVIAQITNILKVNRKITKNLKVTPKMVQVSVRALYTRINPFIPNPSALYPLKSSEKESRVRGIGKKWVNGLAKFFKY